MAVSSWLLAVSSWLLAVGYLLLEIIHFFGASTKNVAKI